jgi:hypothetical protein
MVNPNLYITDDGTMDTVVACAACDWEGRYNPDPGYPNDEPDEGWRVRAALEMAEEDHDCGPSDGPLN